MTGAVEDTANEYELIVLHPSFLPGGFPLMVKHPTTGCLTNFYNSTDGFLHEGNPAGPRLPPFKSRGDVDRDIPLNPILVNFAAHIRLKRLDRLDSEWKGHLHPEAREILAAVEGLHAAVIWEPGQPNQPPVMAQKRVLPTMCSADAKELIHTGNFPPYLLDSTTFSSDLFFKSSRTSQISPATTAPPPVPNWIPLWV